MPNDALHGLLDEVDAQEGKPKASLTSVLDEVDAHDEPKPSAYAYDGRSNNPDGSYRLSNQTREENLAAQDEEAQQSARGTAQRLQAMPGGSNAFVRNAAVGLAQTGQDIASLGMRIVGEGDRADEFNRQGNQLNEGAAIADESSVAPEWLNRSFRGATRSLSGAMLAPGSSAGAMIGQAATIRGNQAITEGSDAGLTPWNTAKYAARAAAIEGGVAALFQKAGIGGIESMMAAKGAVRSGIKGALAKTGISTLEELPEEISTEVLDNVNQAASDVDPNALSAESLKQTILDTTVQTIMSVGFAGGGRYVADRLSPAPVEPSAAAAPQATPMATPPPTLSPQEIADFEHVLSGVTAQPDEVITPLSGTGALTPHTGYNPPVALTPEEIKTLQYRDTMPPAFDTLDTTDESMPEIDPLWNYSPEELRDWGRSHTAEGDTQDASVINDVQPEAITGDNTEAIARIRQPDIRPQHITPSGEDTRISPPITITPKFDESATTQNDIKLPKQDIVPQMEQTSTRLYIPIFQPGEVVNTPTAGHGEVVKTLKSGKVLVDVGDKIISINANEATRANDQGSPSGVESGRGGSVGNPAVAAASGQAPVQQAGKAIPPAPASVTPAPVSGNEPAAQVTPPAVDQGMAKANAYIDSLKLDPDMDKVARDALKDWNPSLDPEGYKGNVDYALEIPKQQAELAARRAKKAAAIALTVAQAKPPDATTPSAEPATAQNAQETAKEQAPEEEAPKKEPLGRPDLANPAKNEQAREFVDSVDEMNKDAESVKNLTREELADKVSKKVKKLPDVVAKEMDDFIVSGEIPDREQAEAWRQLIDSESQKAMAPDATIEQKARAAMLVTLYRQSGAELSRLFSDRTDKVLTPKERHENVRESLIELPQGLKAEVDRLTKIIKDESKKARDAAKKTPPASDAKAPAEKKTGIKRARAALDEQFKKMLAEVNASFGKGGVRSVGGAEFAMVGKLIANRVAAGVLKFADVVAEITHSVRAYRYDPEAHKVFREEWDALAKDNPEMDKSSDVAKIVTANKEMAAERKSENLLAYYKRLADYLTKEAAELSPMSIEKRAEYLKNEAESSEMNPELRGILDGLQRNVKDLRAKVEGAKEEALPTPEESESDRVARLRQGLQGRLSRLSSMSPAELLAEAHERRPSADIQAIRDEARAQESALRKRVKELQNPDRAYSSPIGPEAEQTLDEKIKEEQNRLAKAEKVITDKNAKLRSMTPSERVAAEAEGNLPDEIQKLRAESAERVKKLRKENQELSNPGKAHASPIGPEAEPAYDSKIGPQEDAEIVRLRKDLKRMSKPAEDAKARINKIHENWAKRQEKLQKAMVKMGYDLSDPNAEWANDPAKAARALRYIQTLKTDIWDKIYEYRLASMLSGIGTHVVNTSSNAAHLLWNYSIQRGLESIVNVSGRNKEAAQLGEFKHIFYGIWPGLQQAGVNSIQAMKDEAPVLERTIRGEGIGPNGRTIFDAPPGAISGKKGRIVRLPLALMMAADEAFTSLIANMEVGARAYRIAKGEGLSGEALGERMNQLTGDRTSLAWHQALGHAEDVLFRGDDSATKVLEDLVNKARNLDPHNYDHGAKRAAARTVKEVSRHTIPFLKTLLRVFGTGVRKSPLGSLALAPRLVSNGIGKLRHGPTGWTYDPDLATRDIAEQILAWAVMGALFASLDPDDDDPWITGSGGKYTKQKAELAARTGEDPYTVKIGGERYSYSKLEPFATAMGLTVDAMMAWKRAKTKEDAGKASSLAEDASEAVLGLVKEKTFAKAIGDLTRVAQGEKSAGDLARSTATSFIPNILRATNKATDSTERTAENMPGASWFDKGVASSGVPFVTPPPPKVDLWGRKIDKDSFGNDASGIIGRLISPVKVKHPEKLDLDRLISNYNNTAVTPYWPVTPANYMQVDKKRITFTEDEYQQLLASGAVARKKMEALKMDPNSPADDDIKRIKKEIDSARDDAKKAILKKRKNGH